MAARCPEGRRLAGPACDLERDALDACFGDVHAIALGDDPWVAGADPSRDGPGLETGAEAVP